MEKSLDVSSFAFPVKCLVVLCSIFYCIWSGSASCLWLYACGSVLFCCNGCYLNVNSTKKMSEWMNESRHTEIHTYIIYLSSFSLSFALMASFIVFGIWLLLYIHVGFSSWQSPLVLSEWLYLNLNSTKKISEWMNESRCHEWKSIQMDGHCFLFYHFS